MSPAGPVTRIQGCSLAKLALACCHWMDLNGGGIVHTSLSLAAGPGSDCLSLSLSLSGPALPWVSLLSASDHPSPLFLSFSLFCFLPSVFYPLCFSRLSFVSFSSLLVKSSYLPPLSTPTKTKKRHPDTLNETRPRAPFSFSPSHHLRAPILRVFTTTLLF